MGMRCPPHRYCYGARPKHIVLPSSVAGAPFALFFNATDDVNVGANLVNSLSPVVATEDGNSWVALSAYNLRNIKVNVIANTFVGATTISPLVNGAPIGTLNIPGGSTGLFTLSLSPINPNDVIVWRVNTPTEVAKIFIAQIGGLLTGVFGNGMYAGIYGFTVGGGAITRYGGVLPSQATIFPDATVAAQNVIPITTRSMINGIVLRVTEYTLATPTTINLQRNLINVPSATVAIGATGAFAIPGSFLFEENDLLSFEHVIPAGPGAFRYGISFRTSTAVGEGGFLPLLFPVIGTPGGETFAGVGAGTSHGSDTTDAGTRCPMPFLTPATVTASIRVTANPLGSIATVFLRKNGVDTIAAVIPGGFTGVVPFAGPLTTFISGDELNFHILTDPADDGLTATSVLSLQFA